MLSAKVEAWRTCLKFAAALLLGLGTRLSHAEDRTITLKGIPPSVSTKLFTTIEIVPLKDADGLPANFVIGHGCTQLWDVRVHNYAGDPRSVRYPVLGIVDCPKFAGRSFGVLASTTRIKTELKVDEAVDSADYLIQSKHTFKAGEAIPSLLLMRGRYYSIISIEPVPKQNETNETAMPYLAIFDTHLNQKDRSLAIEAWRLSNKTVQGMFAVPGLFTLVPY